MMIEPIIVMASEGLIYSQWLFKTLTWIFEKKGQHVLGAEYVESRQFLSTYGA
jgi:hypothetical protein